MRTEVSASQHHPRREDWLVGRGEMRDLIRSLDWSESAFGPRALGRSTREIWPEVWHINEPIFAAVMDRGETVTLLETTRRVQQHREQQERLRVMFENVALGIAEVGDRRTHPERQPQP